MAERILTSGSPVAHWQLVSVCFVAALALRTGIALTWPTSAGDGAMYLRVAENIFFHSCVSISDPATAQCVPHWGGNQFPGYPAFIAAVWLVAGHSDVVIQVGQAMVSALAIAYLAHAIFQYSGIGRLSLSAALVTALSPLTLPWSRFVLTEALTIAAVHWLAAEIILSLKLGRFRTSPVGLAIAAAVFVRYDSILLVAPAALAAIHIEGIRRGAKAMMIALLIAAVPLGAWWARSVRAGLGVFPDVYVLLDAPPRGYLAWGSGWTVNQYQPPGWSYPINTRLYSDIRVPPEAFDSPEERRKVQSLLDRLKAYDGLPFPQDIDREFAALAQARLEAHPIRQMIGRPLMRAASMWLSPASSNGWPVELARSPQGATDLWSRASEDPLALLRELSDSLAQILVKLATSLYRMSIVVGAFAAWAAARVGAWKNPPLLLGWAFVFALAQTALHIFVGPPEVRYVVGPCALLETALVAWVARMSTLAATALPTVASGARRS